MTNLKKLSTSTENLISGLAQYLIKDQILSLESVQESMIAAEKNGMPLVTYWVKSTLLSSAFLFDYCKKKFDLPTLHRPLEETTIDPTLINAEMTLRYRVLPIKCEAKKLHLALADPTDDHCIHTISFHTGFTIYPVLASVEDIEKIIALLYSENTQPTPLQTSLNNMSVIEAPRIEINQLEDDDEPVIEFVKHLIDEAIQKKISDIHIEPEEIGCRIRFRRDGFLYLVAELSNLMTHRVITRLKIMAGLNITEKRLPQDGRIHANASKKIDIRVSTCPTLFGEKTVLRLLDNQATPLKIDALGLTPSQQKILLDKLNQPKGLILVTGPTGSGKTITLYTALQYLNCIEKNLCSVEDPIEIHLKGINQVNIHTKIGLDFATLLRTFLRQDPDILMIGEIRDAETANIAIQAAQTGHLVISTLHTNNAAETLTRLQTMGISPQHIASGLSLIVAQRLVRTLCEHCKQPDCQRAYQTLPDQIIYQAVGCEYCHQGYQGRIGIFEFLPITDAINELILSNSTSRDISKKIREEHPDSLWESGLQKMIQGLTSYSELLRVIGTST